MYTATIVSFGPGRKAGMARYRVGNEDGNEGWSYIFFMEDGRKLTIKSGRIVFSNDQIDGRTKSALTLEQKIVFEIVDDNKIKYWATYEDYQKKLQDIISGRADQKSPREMFRVTRGA